MPRLLVINQEGEGGATLMARGALDWAPPAGYTVRYLPGPEGARPEEVLREVQAFEPDLVHAHCWYNAYPYPLLRDLALRHPTAVTVHDPFVVNQYGTECWECYRNPWCLGCPALGPLRRWRPNHRVLERLRKRRINRRTRVHVVAPSRWMLRRLARSEWGRLPASVIPNGVDTSLFRPGAGDRRAFGLPEGPLVLFAGHMYGPGDHRKGLADLLEAFSGLRATLPQARLAVAGRVHAAEVPPGVHLMGPVPEERMPVLLRSADLFCLPTRGDNMPVTVLQALASGVPVLGTVTGGLPEQVEDGVSGRLVPAGRPDRLADALQELLGARERLRSMGEAARHRAEAAFDLQACAGRHLALYGRLLAERVPVSPGG